MAKQVCTLSSVLTAPLYLCPEGEAQRQQIITNWMARNYFFFVTHASFWGQYKELHVSWSKLHYFYNIWDTFGGKA